jgi:hypothetical protein
MPSCVRRRRAENRQSARPAGRLAEFFARAGKFPQLAPQLDLLKVLILGAALDFTAQLSPGIARAMASMEEETYSWSCGKY